MYTIKAEGKTFEFTEIEGKEILRQLFGQYFDIRENLEAADFKASDKMIEFIQDNLFDELLTDDLFWEGLDRNIEWLRKQFSRS